MLVIGVDEVGRGSLIGEVITCAVLVLPSPNKAYIDNVTDSKKLSAKEREDIFINIFSSNNIVGCISCTTLEEIERLNILSAIMLAMRRSIEGLLLSLSQKNCNNIVNMCNCHSFNRDLSIFSNYMESNTSFSIAKNGCSWLFGIDNHLLDNYMIEYDIETPTFSELILDKYGYGTKNQGTTETTHHKVFKSCSGMHCNYSDFSFCTTCNKPFGSSTTVDSIWSSILRHDLASNCNLLFPFSNICNTSGWSSTISTIGYDKQQTSQTPTRAATRVKALYLQNTHRERQSSNNNNDQRRLQNYLCNNGDTIRQPAFEVSQVSKNKGVSKKSSTLFNFFNQATQCEKCRQLPQGGVNVSPIKERRLVSFIENSKQRTTDYSSSESECEKCGKKLDSLSLTSNYVNVLNVFVDGNKAPLCNWNGCVSLNCVVGGDNKSLPNKPCLYFS